MNKDQVKTIEELQSYLGGIPFEENTFEIYYRDIMYYVFEDGTIAMDKSDEYEGLIRYIARDDLQIFWEFDFQDNNGEVIVPILNKTSSLSSKAEDKLMDEEAQDIVNEIHGFAEHMDLVGMYDLTYIISGDEDFDIPDIEFDYGQYFDDFTVGGILQYLRINVPLQMIEDEEWEELDELSDEFDELVENYAPKSQLKEILLGLDDGYDTSERYYHHFLKPDKDGNYSLDSLPSDKINEPFSETFFQFLELLSGLEDPFLNQWALKTFSKFQTGQYQDYVSFDIDLPYENINNNLLKEQLMGVRQSDGTWKATKNTVDLHPFNPYDMDIEDTIRESLLDELDTENYPASTVYHFFGHENRFYIGEYLNIDEYDVEDLFVENAKDMGDGDYEEIFDEYLEYGVLSDYSYEDKEFESKNLKPSETIGNFVVARPKDL